MTSARVRRLTSYAVCGATLLQLVAAAQTKDPMLGRWVLDRARSTFNGQIPFFGGVAPVKRAMTFEVAGDRLRHVIETTLSDTQAEGQSYRFEYTFRIDGQEYPADLQMATNSVSFTRVDTQTVKRLGRYQGKVIEEVTYRISDDGRTLTATTVGTNYDAAGNGIDVGSVQVFTRQP